MGSERYVTTDETRSRYGVAAVSSLTPLKAGDTLSILVGTRRVYLTVYEVLPREGTQLYPRMDLAGPQSADHVACTGYAEVPAYWTPKKPKFAEFGVNIPRVYKPRRPHVGY